MFVTLVGKIAPSSIVGASIKYVISAQMLVVDTWFRNSDVQLNRPYRARKKRNQS